MSKSYRPWTPRQGFLLPPSPMEWLPETHLVYFVLDVVEELNLQKIEDSIQEKDGRGNRPFDPRLMTVLLVYGYCVGIRSSRKLETASYSDVSFRVLAGGAHPDHTAISEFRRVHLAALKGLFVQVLQLCQRAGLVKLAHVALDGTKVQANASKHKAMSYSRMQETQARLEAEVDRLLEEAEQVDREEDARYGVGKRVDEIPEDLRNRESRLKKIREAKAALEAEAAQTRAKELQEQAERARQKAAATESDERTRRRDERRADRVAKHAQAAAEKAADLAKKRAQAAARELQAMMERGVRATQRAARDAATAAQKSLERLLSGEKSHDAVSFPEHKVPADPAGNPRPTAQRCFTDPDSRIQKSGGGYLQGYNGQAAVDDAHQIVVACELTNQPPDVEHLAPMLAQIETNCGALPDALTADAGYWSAQNAEHCKQKNVDAFISVQRDHHGALPAAVPSEGTADDVARREMREKLQTPSGRKTYARRKAVVEPVFGQIKEVRGFRRFLLRGIEKAGGEWSLINTTHNILKLFRADHATRGRQLAVAM
jgi:transposase